MRFSRHHRIALVVLASLALAACREDQAATPPAPVAMTDEALGHYCQMYITDHPGPKAQIHLKGHAAPMWFSQVTDAVTYLRDPEQPDPVVAFYVSDMGKARNWALPGQDNWTDGNSAFYVIDSRQPGGMGVPEAISFADNAAAQGFAAENGGRVVVLADIPDAYLTPAIQGFADNPQGGAP